MRSPIFVFLALVASAAAYTVLSPNAVQGWSNSGPQILTWSRVSTDPQNFTALLTNQKISGFSPQVLAALIDGDLGNTTLNVPNGNGGLWPTGSSFRVNLVRDANNLNDILAQSPEFNITEPTSTSKGVPTTSFSVVTNTQTDTTTPTDASIIPVSAASSLYPAQALLMALLATLGFTLA